MTVPDPIKLKEKFIEKVSQGIIFWKQPFLPTDINYIFDCIEKAKKYDDLQLPFSHRVYIPDLEQQIKQLKEAHLKECENSTRLHIMYENLKSQLEKYEYNGYQVQQSSLANELQQAYTKNEKLQKVIDEIRDPLLQELFKDVLNSMEKSYLEFDEPTYLKTQYKKKMILLKSILLKVEK